MNTTAEASTHAIDQSHPQPLRRPTNDRMIAGVAAGIANYLGAGVPIYLACWLLIPEEGSDQSIASSFVQSRQTRSL